MLADSLKIFSFFSGAGFLDLGFESSGFEVVLANELHKPFLDAYRYARNKMGMPAPIYGHDNIDINAYLNGKSNLLEQQISTLRVAGKVIGFIGGPPCPDFSIAGKNRGKFGDHGKLSSSYIEMIIKYKPDFFLFENVKGLWKTKRHREFFEHLKKLLHSAGYQTTEKLLNSLEFGAPQDRDRIFLFGVNSELCDSGTLADDFEWFPNSHKSISEIKALAWPTRDEFKVNLPKSCPIGIDKTLTVQYWFEKNDVMHHANTKDFFVPRNGLSKMLVIDEGDDSKKSYKRLHRWRYSPTVAYGNNEVHLHPYQARRLSVAEALALQSLPKEFVLPPDMTLTDKFKTVGNGVPFLMAKGIAKSISDYLGGKL